MNGQWIAPFPPIVSRQLADDIGTVFGTLVGAALIEVIRDSLGE
ncbi:hypothetical protein [Rhizobium phaseoli]|nr:hypothetical protein [Rhizobium phaseoli]ANL35389.1 hypothetical protein AMC89_CH03363 [Rhizobium phaseoli]